MKNLMTLCMLLSAAFAMAQSPNLDAEVVWVIRAEDKSYEIGSRADQDLMIYQGNAPQEIQWQKPLVLKKGKTLSVKAPETGRTFFATVYKQDTLVFSERKLAMAGTPNFRDLGGLKTEDGKMVHWNKIFRCGDMGKLEKADLDMIKAMNIVTIVDFRGADEISQSPDKYPEGAEIKKINSVIGISNPNPQSNSLMASLKDPSMTRERMDSLFNEFYKYIVGSMVDFKPLFDELLEADDHEAVLFHCSAGKDRTGVGSALILHSLGVPEETIVEEFYLSNLYTRNLLVGSERFAGLNPAALEVLSGVQPYYIKSTFEEIRKQYGSIDKMLEQVLGIDAANRKLLIEKYTY